MAKDEKEEFRVVDKRRFNNEGDSRNEDQFSKPTASSREQTAHEQTEREGKHAGQNERMDFSSLIVSLATQALVMLGEIPNAAASGVPVNYEAAKQTIDILALLEEKTKGNLTSDEQKLMGEILTSLRLAYVKKVEK